MASILYLGDDHPSSTAAHRAQALRRIGHTVSHWNPEKAIAEELKNSLKNFLHYRTGYRFLQQKLAFFLQGMMAEKSEYDLIWVDSGEFFGLKCLQLLKAYALPIILYNIDDPTGKRDQGRFQSLKKAIGYYDLVVVVREETAEECRLLGAKNVIRVYRSYDEEAHKPYTDIGDIPMDYRSEVAFIGTWMRNEKRDEFLVKLLQQGIPLSIWGDRWQKSGYWNILKKAYRGGALGGRNYVAAMQGANICLGFLSKGNRDLHTTRSLEIPYAGGVLCAERTSEHKRMYADGHEAVFWTDVEECVAVCQKLLSDNYYCEQLRSAGMDKVRTLRLGNEDVCREILQHLKV